MTDLLNELLAVHHGVSRRELEAGEGIGVVLRRTYDAPAADVWDAVTDPDRLRRWFLPVSGDLRVGGKYQLEGNAGGEILRCEPPALLQVSWGGPTSIVELRLTSESAESTTLELEHTVPLDIAGSGAGALFVGPGWDIAVLGLALFLRGEPIDDPVAWENTTEVQRYSERGIQAWIEAITSSGTATADEIAGGAAMARAQFTPDLTT